MSATASTFVEESVFFKPFTGALVCGDCHDNRSWSSILLQTLFVKTLQRHESYDHIFICADNGSLAIFRGLLHHYQLLYSLQLQDKVREVSSLAEVQEVVLPNSATSTARELPSVAVFSPNFSELILDAPSVFSSNFLVPLRHLQRVYVSSPTTLPSRDVKAIPRCHLFAALHTSWSAPEEVHRWRSYFPTVINLRPVEAELFQSSGSNQTSSQRHRTSQVPVVVAELQLVRRSERSGKISEGTVWCKWHSWSSLLGASTVSSVVIQQASQSSIFLWQVTPSQQSTSSAASKTEQETASQPSAATATTTAGAAAAPQRLVFFDRTDPEFADMDEDPDADLDL